MIDKSEHGVLPLTNVQVYHISVNLLHSINYKLLNTNLILNVTRKFCIRLSQLYTGQTLIFFL